MSEEGKEIGRKRQHYFTGRTVVLRELNTTQGELTELDREANCVLISKI